VVVGEDSKEFREFKEFREVSYFLRLRNLLNLPNLPKTLPSPTIKKALLAESLVFALRQR
jgi:hypothetical protein